MNFGRKGLDAEMRRTRSVSHKLGSKTVLSVLKIGIAGMLLLAVLCSACVLGAVKGIIAGAPDISDIDISPQGLETTIYDSQGNVIQVLIGSGANRSLVTYNDLPKDLVNAFVALEDSRFWTHEGIDLKGIIRAAFVGVANGFNFSEGASTFTQQLIKNNVLGGGSEKTTGARLVRKIQEQSLALELEKRLSKEKILENYLNTINLGANCLGVEKAAERYFNKSVSELTLSECAVIAAITQNPYGLNPIRFPEKNAVRREKVLRNMEEQGYISHEQREEALADDVYKRIELVNTQRKQEETVYSYFVDRLIRDVLRDLQAEGYTKEEATAMLYSGGLHIYTTQDPDIQRIVDEEIANEANYENVTQKFSFTYTLRVTHSDKSVSIYSAQNIRTWAERTYLDFDTREEIEQLVADYKASVVSETDTVSYESLDITLQPQVSVVLMDQATGQVKAIAGGRGEKTASLSLNRATNTFRQPGSTFKVLASFAPALNEMGDTLATTFYDEPYSVEYEGTTWTPKNWYSKSKYAGYANIRQAITYSMNIVAVRCLVEDVGSARAFEYLEKFGINTLIPQTDETIESGKHDVRPTLALGGVTQGVTNMQLTGAYAAIANGGYYVEPVLYTRILDDDGRVIIDNVPETHQVVSEETAFLLTSAMSDSLEDTRLNDLFSSSSPEAKLSNLPAAGKSGTTSSYNDLWFVGYSPYYTMGIWSGFDDNAKFETSDDRDFHKTMWKIIMERVTADKPYVNFNMPGDIITAYICNKSGKLATGACALDPRDCIVTTEYFIEGTEPTEYCDLHKYVEVCTKSGMKPGPNCESTTFKARIRLPEERNGGTQDDNYAGSPSKECDVCKPGGADAVTPTP